jgi:hypothetical protein
MMRRRPLANNGPAQLVWFTSNHGTITSTNATLSTNAPTRNARRLLESKTRVNAAEA